MLEFSDALRFTRPPWAVQRMLYGTVAPLARLLGYQACNSEYLDRRSSETTELEDLPDEVAALL